MKKRKRKQGGRGDSSNLTFLFFYFFNVNSFLCTVFTIIIIKCKVSFSSHSSSSHYSMQGFIFIIISSFWGVLLKILINYMISKCELVFFSHFRMDANVGTC